MKNKDEKLYNSLNKLELSKFLLQGDSLNIYMTYKKIKKGCYINISSNLSRKFENILDKYNLLYKKYGDVWNSGDSYYFISNITNPKNIEFFDSKNKLNHLTLGKFL
jgi:predicted Zn-dependent peptidase